MHLSWKDFVIAFIIGMLLGTGLLNQTVNAFRIPFDPLSFLFLFVLFGIPLAYYFRMNRCERNPAAMVSFAFGFSFFPLFFVFMYVLESIVLAPLFGRPPPDPMPIHGGATPETFIPAMLLMGMVSLLPGMAAWYLACKIRKGASR